MHLVQRARKSVFLRQNAVFFVGSLLVGVLNYLYYPVLGRLLSPAIFGEVQTLISLFLQFTIFLNVLTFITVGIVASHRQEAERNRIVYELERLALVVAIVFLLASVAAAPWLQHFLHFNASEPFIALALALVISVPLTFRSGYLRGMRQFAKTSVVGIVASVAKLALSVLLVVVGLGTVGAIWGLVGAQAVALLYAVVAARRLGLFASGGRYFRLPRLRGLSKELKYAAVVLGASLAITLQYSIDVIVVKHYFDPHTAGLYAGIATAARIIFFLTASISQVMMPAVKPDQPAKQNQHLLLKSFGLLWLAAGPVLLICLLAPGLLVQLVMGPQYTELSSILPALSLAMMVIALLNLFVTYHIALRRTGVAVVGIIGSVVTVGLMIAYHDSVQLVVNSLLFGSVIMMCLLGAWIGKTKLLQGNAG